MKMRRPRLAVVFYILLFAAPVLAYAQATGLVPCGTANFGNFMQATGCNFCYLSELIQRIVNFLIMVSIPISVAMFAWAGILFFTSAGNPKGIAHAKKIFSSVFIGFLIALSGWLIVQTILQAITNTEFYTAASWSTLNCEGYNNSRPRNGNLNSVLGAISVSPGQNPNGTNVGGGTASNGETYVDSEARTQLQLGNVSVNKLNCANTSQTDCTSLEGIQKSVVTQVVNLAEACGCSLTVTGGTEAGHAGGDASHGSGNKIDIGLGVVDSYIQSMMTSVGNRSGDNAPQWKDAYGNIYAKEGNHWDILIKASGPLQTKPSS